MSTLLISKLDEDRNSLLHTTPYKGPETRLQHKGYVFYCHRTTQYSSVTGFVKDLVVLKTDFIQNIFSTYFIFYKFKSFLLLFF